MKKPSIPAIASITIILVAVGFYFFNNEFQQWANKAYDAFSTGEVKEVKKFLEPYREIGYLILLGAFLFQLFLFFIPSVLVMSLSIMMYGPWLGGGLCLLGVFLASVFAYFLGHALGTYTIDKIIGHDSREKMETFLEKYGFWTVTVFRLSPFLSNDAVSFVGGLVNMSFWRFIGATMLGITPLTIILAWMGEDTERVKIGFMILGGISILALGLYIFIDKRKATS
ncbi:TVP38/TMEM64 family protein [Owenweeksia hongkongensis]|uniref:TVP38/TMEM64 family protein n=1 Tax=Owenweeksia hongkongensis TaxID=253245 RepID=UPI003A950E35